MTQHCAFLLYLSDNKLPVIGSTITISKCPDKGTVVIKKLEEPADQKDTPDAPADGVQSQKGESVVSEGIICISVLITTSYFNNHQYSCIKNLFVHVLFLPHSC